MTMRVQIAFPSFAAACFVSVFSFSSSNAFADATALSPQQLRQLTETAAEPSSPVAPSYSLGQQNVATPSSVVNQPVMAVPQANDSAEALGQAVLSVKGNADVSPSSNPTGGSSYGVDTTLYSAPIDKSWRLFAGEYFAHEVEPTGEGSISFSRSMAGAEWHNDFVTAEAAPTFNHFNGTDRVGGTGDVSWSVNDYWLLSAGAQYFSRDIPLRALNAGITANSYDANAMWIPNTSRDLTLDGNIMTFSDGNFRTTESGMYTEHFFTSSRYSIDGLGDLTASQNSKNEDVLYYNPSKDVQAMGGARITQPLYHDHQFLYEHSFEFTPGLYWQQGYGSSPALNAVYKQKLKDLGHFDADASLNYSRQSYDGGPAENSVAILVDLTQRF
jgi:biofilm PGA synthesis protein PgaA